MKIDAVFLDRDGILNVYLPKAYVRNPGELRVIPGVASAIRKLNDAGIKVIVISNQQGVGKGMMTMGDLQDVENAICSHIDDEAGARLDKCYYCTDLNSSNSPRRKPSPGMLVEAASDFGLTLENTVFIGDSATDIAAGSNGGVGAKVLVLSGATKEYNAGDMNPEPDYVFNDLGIAVDWVLENNK